MQLEAKVSLFNSNTGTSYGNFTFPQTFEALELYSGFMLYETVFPYDVPQYGLLMATGIHDRAIIYVNKVSS